MALITPVYPRRSCEPDQNEPSDHYCQSVSSSEGSQIGEDSPVLCERPRESEQGQQQTERHEIVDNSLENGPVDQSAKKYTDPQRVPSEGSNPTLAYSKWRVPAAMFGLVLLGILIGIGHHLCYNYLNGKPVANYSQTWILRIATGAAFLVKVILALSVGIALSHVKWFFLRRRHFKIGSLDKMFTLQSSLLSFFSRDLLAAPLVLIMAALFTLTVTYTTRSSVRPCKVPVFGVGSASSLTVWEQAPGGGRTQYGGPAPLMAKIAAKTIVGGTPMDFSSPCGQNCSYSTSFMGPAMSCDTQPFGVGRAVLGPDTVHDSGHSDFFYYYAVPDNQYQSMLWVLRNKNDSPNALPEILLCSTSNTTYNVNVTFNAGTPKFITAIGNLTKAEMVDWGESFDTAYYASVGIENATMRRALDMAATRDSLYGNLAGLISMRLDEQNAFESNTSFVLSNLVDITVNDTRSTFHLNRDIKTGIPELMQNITLSVMGANHPTSTAEWFYTLVADGVPVEDNFSQILVTIRNPALDEISDGLCLTSNQAAQLKEQRIRLGELIGEEGRTREGNSGVCHAAFGLEGQTMPIQKGGNTIEVVLF
ncbi:hypothetical protein PENSOL_c010G03914 [Penicillium solitum]|uniref:Uncharacterized protein n=1 Tax=Penicillium solitum TaxID=60172 RepID=A0A1V6R943_9EURO|nr:uncharacterized protein PENSOL_c010G03914 [Penicillium solitum]OQD98050.1 hypothetical protein PENSOL_c010G03914 [Penicillium solitum]